MMAKKIHNEKYGENQNHEKKMPLTLLLYSLPVHALMYSDMFQHILTNGYNCRQLAIGLKSSTGKLWLSCQGNGYSYHNGLLLHCHNNDWNEKHWQYQALAKIQNSWDSSRCLWECILVQPLWKTVLRCLLKLHICIHRTQHSTLFVEEKCIKPYQQRIPKVDERICMQYYSQ